MLERKRIKLMILTGTLSGGGAERFVSTSLIHLDRKKFEPHLALFRNEISYPVPPDVPIVVVGDTPSWQKIPAIRKLAKWIDEHQPDIVIGAYWHPTMHLAEALRWTKHRPAHITWVVSDPARGALAKTVNHVWAQRSYRQVDMFVAVSSGVAQAFGRLFPFAKDRIRVLPNSVDFEFLDKMSHESVRSELPLDDRPLLVTVARLEPQKRLDVLIDAFARVRERIDVQLVILGEGSLRSTLEHRIDRLGLTSNVQLPGFVANPYPWMRRADVLVLSSDDEGFGIVLVEAQGLGVPVVATDCPHGPSEIIRHNETGLLVPVGDSAAMAIAICHLLEEPEKRIQMGETARIDARAMFGVERLGAQLADILVDAAKERRAKLPRDREANLNAKV